MSPQGQSYGPARVPPGGTVQAHTSAAPAQSSVSPQPQAASSNRFAKPNIQATPQPAAPPAYGVVTPPSTGTTIPGTLTTNLTPGTVYGFQVQALGPLGPTDFSTLETFMAT